MHREQLRELIQEVLEQVQLDSPEAVELLLGTAAVESQLGRYIKQINGPALGIFQMEPNTEDDIWKNYLEYKEELAEDVRTFVPEVRFKDADLKWNIAYQILMARIHYLRVPEALPGVDDIEGQAAYWKKYYNTHLGAGTVEKYITCYKLYVKG